MRERHRCSLGKGSGHENGSTCRTNEKHRAQTEGVDSFLLPEGMLIECFHAYAEYGLPFCGAERPRSAAPLRTFFREAFGATDVQFPLSMLEEDGRIAAKRAIREYSDALTNLVVHLWETGVGYEKLDGDNGAYTWYCDLLTHAEAIGERETRQAIDGCLRKAYALFSMVYLGMLREDAEFDWWRMLSGSLLAIGCIERDDLLIITPLNPVRMLYLAYQFEQTTMDLPKKIDPEAFTPEDLVINSTYMRYGFQIDFECFFYRKHAYFIDFGYLHKLSWVAYARDTLLSRTVQNVLMASGKISRYLWKHGTGIKALRIAFIGDVDMPSLLAMLRRVLRSYTDDTNGYEKRPILVTVYASEITHRSLRVIMDDQRSRKRRQGPEDAKTHAFDEIVPCEEEADHYRLTFDCGEATLIMPSRGAFDFGSPQFYLDVMNAHEQVFIMDNMTLLEGGGLGLSYEVEGSGLRAALETSGYDDDRWTLSLALQRHEPITRSAFVRVLQRLSVRSFAPTEGRHAVVQPPQINEGRLYAIKMLFKRSTRADELFIYSCVPYNYRFAQLVKETQEVRSEMTPYPHMMKLIVYNKENARGAESSGRGKEWYTVRLSKALQVLNPDAAYLIRGETMWWHWYRLFAKYMVDEGLMERFCAQYDKSEDTVADSFNETLKDHRMNTLDDMLLHARLVVTRKSPGGDNVKDFQLRPVMVSVRYQEQNGSWYAPKEEKDCLPLFAQHIFCVVIGEVFAALLKQTNVEGRMQPFYRRMFDNIMISCTTTEVHIADFMRRIQGNAYLRVDTTGYGNEFTAEENKRFSGEASEQVAASIQRGTFADRYRQIWLLDSNAHRNKYYGAQMMDALYDEEERNDLLRRYSNVNTKLQSKEM